MKNKTTGLVAYILDSKYIILNLGLRESIEQGAYYSMPERQDGCPTALFEVRQVKEKMSILKTIWITPECKSIAIGTSLKLFDIDKFLTLN